MLNNLTNNKMKISGVFLLFIFILNTFSVHGFEGTNVWKIDGFIEYNTSIIIDYNHDATYFGTPFFDPIEFPDVSITDAQMTLRYAGIIAGNMKFETTTTNNDLRNEFLEEENPYINLIDPKTNIDEDGDYIYHFTDTSGWEDDKETSVKEIVTYEDSIGEKETIKFYRVAGDLGTLEISLNGASTKINVWDITVDDFDVEYSDGTFDWKESQSNLIMRFSESGIRLAISGNLKISLKDAGSTSNYVDLTMLSITMEAIEISEGVIISNSTEDKSSGLSIIITSSTFLVILIIIIERKK